jgi:hypothetical protein
LESHKLGNLSRSSKLFYEAFENERSSQNKESTSKWLVYDERQAHKIPPLDAIEMAASASRCASCAASVLSGAYSKTSH